MANEQNLKKFGSEREPSEAGRKGGKASGVARRRKRDMKNAAKLLLNMPVTGENTIKNLETLGFEEEDMTNQMAAASSTTRKMTRSSMPVPRDTPAKPAAIRKRT